MDSIRAGCLGWVVSIDVRIADDLDRFTATDEIVWAGEEIPGTAARIAATLPADARFAAHTDNDPAEGYAGIYGVFPLRLGLPGGAVPEVAGLTYVGVHPDARRRGVLSAMMSHHLTRCRDAAQPLSILHASEPGIYGRFGYGAAASGIKVDLGRGTTLVSPHLAAPADTLTTRTVTASTAGVTDRIRALALGQAQHYPGTVVAAPELMALIGQDRPEELRGREPVRVLFAQEGGVDVGCAAFRRTPHWPSGRPSGTVTVDHLYGTPEARLALARRLVDMDLMSSTAFGPVAEDTELLDWIGGPYAAVFVGMQDATWVRLVDVGAAWELRSYDADCDVVVELTDRFAPWNAGRWRLAASGGSGTAARTDAPADVTVSVHALAAAYLGRPAYGMKVSGIVAEHRAGAYAELTRALRTDRLPSPSMMF